MAASAEDETAIADIGDIEGIKGQALMAIQRLVSLEQAKKRRK